MQIKGRFSISLLRRDLSYWLTKSRLQNTNLPAKLNQLMRPAKAAPAVPFSNLPLCQHPNVCVNSAQRLLLNLAVAGFEPGLLSVGFGLLA